jgi:hypothetical protein
MTQTTKAEPSRARRTLPAGFAGEFRDGLRHVLSFISARPTPTPDPPFIGKGGIFVTIAIVSLLTGGVAYFAFCLGVRTGRTFEADELIPFKTAQQDDLAKLGFSKL